MNENTKEKVQEYEDKIQRTILQKINVFKFSPSNKSNAMKPPLGQSPLAKTMTLKSNEANSTLVLKKLTKLPALDF